MNNTTYIKIPLKNIINVSKIITVYCYDFAPNYFFHDESHDFWELLYVDRGEIDVRSDGNLIHLCAGNLFFHYPNTVHGVQCDGTHSATVFIITFECRSAAMDFFRKSKQTLPKELLPLMQALINECVSNFHHTKFPLKPLPVAPLGGLQLVRIYLEMLLLYLMRMEEKKSSTTKFISRDTVGNTLMQDVCTYLSEHLYERVSLDRISHHFHLGKSRLCELFKEYTGDTIIHYYLKLRINEAKKLLRETNLTVTEISELLAFVSPTFFSRQFHQYTGLSPRAFRNRLVNGTYPAEKK